MAMECHSTEGLERIGCFEFAKYELNAIRYVQENTSDDERIFVGVPTHERFVGNDVMFYFASQQALAPPRHQLDPGVQTTEEVQNEMVAELALHKPKCIVINSVWNNIREPNDSRRSSGVTILDDYIRENYRPSARFGPIEIHLLRSPQ
jgi:hypothetical protein